MSPEKPTPLHFLITAGPTREYLDPVRFLTNGSTGKMGYACAAAAHRRGHQVTLISGPMDLDPPPGVKPIQVVSSAEMARAVEAHFDACDCVVMTAAVCDYRPAKPQKQKIKKGKSPLILKLQRTTDILAELGNAKTDKILIGFAVEDHNARKNARKKLLTKNLDAIVLNAPSAFGADRGDAHILCQGGKWKTYRQIRKTALATTLIALAQRLASTRT